MNNNRKVAITVRYDSLREETMHLAEQAGFKYVCMGFGEADIFTHDGWEKQISDIVSELERYHLECADVHLPVYDLRDSGEITDPVIDRSILRCVRAAKMLGANVCAYHSRSHFIDGKWGAPLDLDASLKDNITALAPIVEEAEKQNVIIGVENMPPAMYPDHKDDLYSDMPEELVDMISAFESSHICALWDTGHAHLTDRDQADQVRYLGKRIKATHIHNNMRDYDMHYPPSMGNIDWQSVMKAFRDIGYDGYLTLESSYYHGAISDAYVRHLYDCICRLDDMLNAE